MSLRKVLTEPGTALLQVEERQDELRITTRLHRRDYSAIGAMLFGVCLSFAMGINTPSSRYFWFHLALSSAVGVVFVLLGLRELRRPEQSVWVVNARDRRLEHNEKVVARFDEMRVVWAAPKTDRKEACHVLGLTLHQNRTHFDIVLDRALVKESALAEFEHAARLIAQHAGIRCKEG